MYRYLAASCWTYKSGVSCLKLKVEVLNRPTKNKRSVPTKFYIIWSPWHYLWGIFLNWSYIKYCSCKIMSVPLYYRMITYLFHVKYDWICGYRHAIQVECKSYCSGFPSYLLWGVKKFYHYKKSNWSDKLLYR